MIKSVARPWDATFTATKRSVVGIFQPYLSTRDKCFKARQEAIQVKKKYDKLFKEAKSAMHQAAQLHAAQQQQQQQNDHTSATPLAPTPNAATATPTQDAEGIVQPHHNGETSQTSKSPQVVAGYGWEQLKLARKQAGLNRHAERLLQILDSSKATELEYISLVQEENQAVERTQTMETMGLESLQKLEEVSTVYIDVVLVIQTNLRFKHHI